MPRNQTVHLLHSDEQRLKAYQHAIEKFNTLRIESLTTDMDELITAIIRSSFDYLMIGGFGYDYQRLEPLSEMIVLECPAAKIILLDVEWVNTGDKCIHWPVRGMLDYYNQNPAEFQHCLNRILKKGWNFDLLLNNRPDLTSIVEHYANNTPLLDVDFWKLLPMISTKFSQSDIADYMGYSVSKLKRVIQQYCDTLGVMGCNELLVLATQNRWLNRKMVHAAHDKMLAHKFNNGTLLDGLE